MFLDLLKSLRTLAKSSYYQTLYSLSKDLRVKLFVNDYDFTNIQLTFLHYIALYSNVSMDIALGEVDEIVLDNDIYTDAYLMYKNKKDKKTATKPQYTPNLNDKTLNKISSSNWIFKQPVGKGANK